jgi:polar amino acid transport system substrate-binding protein
VGISTIHSPQDLQGFARKTLPVLLLLVAALLLAACGDDDSSSSDSAAKPTATADACTMDSLETQTPGTLTIATDKPAFPPYFIDDEPSNGKGFESVVAY